MKAYGWRITKKEQGRANGIFNVAVASIKVDGLAVDEAKSPAVSNDITLLKVTGQNRNVLMIWSAGTLGLVLAECRLVRS